MRISVADAWNQETVFFVGGSEGLIICRGLIVGECS